MRISPRVQKILSNYDSENPAVKAKLAQLLMNGRLGGTGKMIILPVDQGIEHGPARSFAVNPGGYDPFYHHQLAIDAGLNAYAAPLGQLEVSTGKLYGQVPTILKLNHSNSLSRLKEDADQAIFGSVEDALRLGCTAIGFTIYPGSDQGLEQMEEIAELIREAKAVGLPTVLWSYPRGGNISKDGETAIDVVAYAAHLASQLGAHVIKVKLPTDFIEQKEAKKEFDGARIAIGTQAERVAEVMRSCFAGRRIVVFSGGAAKDTASVLDDARAIRDGGGNGSIIGRNCFRRPRDEALELLDTLVRIFQGKE
ncbi:class I fructose-bisphosphate aldolase [Inquilinus limosus]|uniref:fructose-bisphosphate aldolase n=1 Tax=Inquilinus limosus TaxID=171674 RepID=A0A211ZR44_9PROT|nr:class I fructose-bisphosphate aldolase [Inquilinus limosus]OWJ67748.1 fructose-bisphosphate aldolase [Inquilinus limosus]